MRAIVTIDRVTTDELDDAIEAVVDPQGNLWINYRDGSAGYAPGQWQRYRLEENVPIDGDASSDEDPRTVAPRIVALTGEFTPCLGGACACRRVVW